MKSYDIWSRQDLETKRPGSAWVTNLLPWLLLLSLPLVVQAQFLYTTNNGAIVITGYTGTDGAASIPSVINGLPVTGIKARAFASSTNLTSVGIPNSVTNIGNSAFYCCWRLTAITVDAMNPCYSTLDGVLFNQSQSLLIQCPVGKAGSYLIPNGVLSVGQEAFYCCTNLASITIPNTVTNIGEDAFCACTSLMSITVPDSVTSLGDCAFDTCMNLTNATIGNGVTSLGSDAFDYCLRLASVSIGTNVSYIGEYAFSFCTSLRAVTIPNSVTNLDDCAFDYCPSLSSVTIGSGVTRIGNEVFLECNLSNVFIPNNVRQLGIGAFYSCTNLLRVTIGKGVTNIGTCAFADCTTLSGVYFLGDAPRIGYDLFSGDANALIYYLPGTTGWGSTFDDWPTVLWNPQVETRGISSWLRTNHFGFRITGTSNLVVVVEACPSLDNPVWSPLATNILTGGSSYFTDPPWTNFPGRFYRLRSP